MSSRREAWRERPPPCNPRRVCNSAIDSACLELDDRSEQIEAAAKLTFVKAADGTRPTRNPTASERPTPNRPYLRENYTGRERLRPKDKRRHPYFGLHAASKDRRKHMQKLAAGLAPTWALLSKVWRETPPPCNPRIFSNLATDGERGLNSRKETWREIPRPCNPCLV